MYAVIRMLRSETKWFHVFISKVREDVIKLSTKSEVFSHPWFLLAYEILRMVCRCCCYREVNSILREYKNEYVEARLQIFEVEAKIEASSSL